MGRFEGAASEAAALGAAGGGADVFFKLGMTYSTGSSVPADYVSAHKWFNLAAMRGCKEALRLRREMAALMSEAEISAAQRAARDWIGC
jgi:TPR repeat protein